MSKALLGSIVLSALGIVGLAAALGGLSQVKTGIANLQERVTKIEASPRGTTGGTFHDNSAELAKLKKDLAELRALIASIPSGGGGGGGLTMNDLKKAIEGVMASNKLHEQEVEAQKQGEQMTVASRKRVEDMGKSLALDEAQKLRVQDVLNSQIEAYVKFWSNPPTGPGKNPTTTAYLDGMKSINETATNAIKGILTPEQATKYDAMQPNWFPGMAAGPMGPRR